MSRITPPVKNFHSALRSISSSSPMGRPSSFLDSQARGSAYLPQAVKDLKAECNKRALKSTGSKAELIERLSAHDLINSHGFHTFNTASYRPVTNKIRIIPLMQGFRTSAPKATAHDTSTIDYTFLPSLDDDPPTNPFSKLRVPLLPDNYTPDRSAGSLNATETLDGAIPGSEISILAGNPDSVASALSEVVGNDGLDVDIGQLTSVFSTLQSKGAEEPGVLKELWSGVLDDIFGSKNKNATAA